MRNRKITSFGIGIILMLALFAVISPQAAAASAGIVTTNDLNVRSAPSTSGEVYGQLDTGDKVTIIAKTGSWLKISYQGRTAYVHSNYVKAASSNTDTEVFVNHEQVALPIEPPIKNGHVLVPFREIGEALGIQVSWLKDTKQVRAIDNGKEVLFTINKNEVIVDGKKKTVSPAPAIEKNYTVIPLRFFAEEFDATVGWNQSTRTVYITREKVLDEEDQQDPDDEVVQPPSKPDPKPEPPEPEVPTSNIKGTVLANQLNVRSGPGTNYGAIESLGLNAQVAVLGFSDNWAKINTGSKVGYVHSYYLKMTRNGNNFISLSSPKITNGDYRDWLTWSKLGRVNSSHYLTSTGVAIKTNAYVVEPLKQNHPGIKNISYQSISGGTKISIDLNDGWHYVARHDGNQVAITILPSGLKGKRIIVDAGHGDHDPGTQGPTGTQEKEVNLSIAQRLAKLLTDAGADVTLTRNSDVFVTLADRVRIAENKRADAFISVHNDAFSATSRGSTTFYHLGVNPSGDQSKQLSDIAIKKLTSKLGTYDRGSQNKSLHVIRESTMPATLVEIAFLSNPSEEALLKTDSFRQKAAQALYDTFVDYYK